MIKDFELDGIGRQKPFSVPDGYFDSFQQKMDKNTATSKVSFHYKKQLYWSVAATIVLVAIAGTIVVNLLKGTNNNISHKAEVEYEDAIEQLLQEEASLYVIEDYILADSE